MSQDEFTKLFKYVQDMRREMNARFDETATKNEVNDLRDSVDTLADVVKNYQQCFRMVVGYD